MVDIDWFRLFRIIGFFFGYVIKLDLVRENIGINFGIGEKSVFFFLLDLNLGERGYSSIGLGIV